MALETWEWYTKLVEKGSFTKAADSLGVSQQTLSARLASLEKDVGAKLVERGTPLSFTQAGLAFLMYAREQQQAQEDLLRQIGGYTGGSAGVLKVGLPQMRARSIMPRIMAIALEELPDITFRFVEETNRELVRKTERGEVDLVIARFGNSHPGIEVTPLRTERIVLTIREDLLCKVTGRSVEDALATIEREGIGILRDCPFCLGTVDDISGRVAYSELRNAGIKPHIVAQSEYTSTLLAVCAAGLGAAFCPSNMIDELLVDPEPMVSIPLSSQAEYTISIGTPTQATEWRAVEVLKQALLANAGDEA
jgi:DNA-binding transcriptional LysR family regulator